MLISLKNITVPVGSGAQTAQFLSVPASSFINIGDTIIFEFYGRTVAGGGSPCIWGIQVNCGSFTKDGDDHQIANINCTVDGDDKWRVVTVATLCGNGLIKFQTFMDNFRNADAGSDDRQDYSEVYCNPAEVTNVELHTDLDSGGANFEVTLAKAYLIKNPNGPLNTSTPGSPDASDGVNFTFTWDAAYPDPVSWRLLAQRSDNLAWVDVGSNALGGSRDVIFDAAAMAEGDIPALGDFWNGKLLVVGVDGIDGNGEEITNRSAPSLSGLT